MNNQQYHETMSETEADAAMQEENDPQMEVAAQDCQEATACPSTLDQEDIQICRSCPKADLSEEGNGSEVDNTLNFGKRDDKNIRCMDQTEKENNSHEEAMPTSSESSDVTGKITYCKDEEILFGEDNRKCNADNNNCSSADSKIALEQSQGQVHEEDHLNESGDRHGASHLRRSYLSKSVIDNTINQPNSSYMQNETGIDDTFHPNSESQNYTEMTNLPVDMQESCCDRKYACYYGTFEDGTHARQIKPISPKKQDPNYASMYNCFGERNLHNDGGCCLNSNSDDFHGEHYSYELQNKNIYQIEEGISVERLPTEKSSIRQPTNCRGYEEGQDSELTHERSYTYLQYGADSGNTNFEMNNNYYYKTVFGDEENTQMKCNSLVQRADEYMCEFKNTHIKREEMSAIDLRILRPLRYTTMTSQIQASYNIQDQMIISHESDESYITHPLRDNAFLIENNNKQGTNILSSSYIIPDQITYKEAYNNMIVPARRALSFDYNVCETSDGNHNSWDAATNTDHTMVRDKESQTGLLETRDVAVQTDVETTIPFTFFKTIEKEIAKHRCPICHRVYISKTSFDRHRRTHEKEKNNNLIANVRFTTEAKLQICKSTTKTKSLKAQKPIIIHVPRSIFKCELCHKTISNQEDKYDHNCSFKPFSLIKCPECNVKFYTTGALNEHIGILHKKDNAYYCIFCNKSFNAGYNFHLHLDEHLSAQ